MLRGINRQDIFEEPEDYWTFIKILSTVQENLIRDVMIEIGSGPRLMSRVSGMSYNIIQYMWKNNEEKNTMKSMRQRHIILFLLMTLFILPVSSQETAGSNIVSRTLLLSDGSKAIEQRVYDNGLGTPCWNGDICAMTWRNSKRNKRRGYTFLYDDVDRLPQATYGERDDLTYNIDRFSENVGYDDVDGNITAITRYGKTSANGYGQMDNLTLSYNGYQLEEVSETVADYNVTGSFEYKKAKGSQYKYNNSGSLIADKSRDIAFILHDYNNNPCAIYFTNGNVTKYVYSGSGEKLRVVHYTAKPNITRTFGVKPAELTQAQILYVDSTDYLLGGSLVVKNGRIDKCYFEGGFARAFETSATTDRFVFYYYNKDHLGNNREVVDIKGRIHQVTNYYPFGAPYADENAIKGESLQPYKYNGKELDLMHGLNTYDYGARQYDPILARWDRVDPLCEKDYPTSPYVFCGNNPVNRVDKDGRIWDTVLDLAFVAYDAAEAAYQYCTTGHVSNTTKAALGADALAAAVPGLTGQD